MRPARDVLGSMRVGSGVDEGDGGRGCKARDCGDTPGGLVLGSMDIGICTCWMYVLAGGLHL